MLRKEVSELFSLCMQVTTETSAFVLFRMGSRTKACHIEITDKGYDYNGRTDGSYSIYFDNELLEEPTESKMTTYDIYRDEVLMEESVKNYEAAKEHLTRLLKENGS
mgnify:CR=1 FL=1